MLKPFWLNHFHCSHKAVTLADLQLHWGIIAEDLPQLLDNRENFKIVGMDSEQCSNLEKQIQQVLHQNVLTEKEVRILCEKAREILQEESNLLHVQVPVTVCGDVHGQFYDLKELLDIGGPLPQTNYLL